MLDKLRLPQDLKTLNIEQLRDVATQVRARIIEVVSTTGGHLASSLGTVELAVALHHCLDAPKDKIIWDVGHQAYAHKILTGRNKEFVCLRQYNGITGFPCKDESVFDPFTTGHSSTAVSLALGLACGRDCLASQGYFRVVAVIGDGSLSGGLCFEGLNNAGHLKKDMLVVLNTNELSIAPNVGAISTYLNKLISQPIYNRFRNSLENVLKSRVPKGSRILKMVNKFEEGLKGLFIPGMVFEELGFRYFGPLDGHNLPLLISTLKNIQNIKGPVLLHVITKKGRGFLPAERDPVRFHSTGPFNINDGTPILKGTVKSRSYTEVFKDTLLKLAKTDKKIVAITAAMPEGTGVDAFRDFYPDRFFDVGIAEGHAVCFAAGLAQQGLRPIVAIYSTFLQRAYDQIIEDVALQNLPVIFAIDRAGIVGEDGATHQGVFDIAFLRSIPNIVMMAPKDGNELEAMIEFAVALNKPVAVRYPRAQAADMKKTSSSEIAFGKAEVLRESKDAEVAIIAVGSMAGPSLAAAEILGKDGIKVSVVNSRFIKPLDISLFKHMTKNAALPVCVEEGVRDGGFGSAVSEALGMPVVRIGLPDDFIPCGKREALLAEHGLTSEGIVERIKKELKARRAVSY